MLAVAFAALMVGLGAACGGDEDGGGAVEGLAGRVQTDGSATVAPFTALAADRFENEHPGVSIIIHIVPSGTGAGFERFCRGGIDLLNASRPIHDDEERACGERGIEYVPFHVASDALTMVVNRENDWADCLTLGELRRIWEPGSTIDSWREVRPRFPDEKLELFGRAAGSGTFDFFTQVIVGKQGASRGDYTAREDEFGTAQGVQGAAGGLGYVGLAYFSENEDDLKALEIDGGSGCVAPSVETAQSGDYEPLSRPLFVYVKRESLRRRAVRAFVKDMIDSAQAVAEEGQFVPLTDEQLGRAHRAFDRVVAGAGA